MNRPFKNLIHRLGHRLHRASHEQFLVSLAEPEASQRGKLDFYLRSLSQDPIASGLVPDACSIENLQGLSYEQFRDRVPVQRYADLEAKIERLRATQKIRFEPTSGSTSRRKWIPYSPKLMVEFDAAASAWLYDLGQRYPGISQGSHFWSLSWLPTELRKEMQSTDDLQVFGGIKKWAMERIMAVPGEVSLLPTLQASKFATLAFLAVARDLSMISVWSPTFLLMLLEDMSRLRKEIAATLESGEWRAADPAGFGEVVAPASKEIARMFREWNGSVDRKFLSKLWPKLALISTWDSSTSRPWAERLRELFGSVDFQGKGLWATEGCVTIPFQGQKLLALTAHFYEFLDIETQRVHPSWELAVGQRVKPLLTTGGGFLRYMMEDILEVRGFLGKCPHFEFMGRLNTVDLAGEKIDATLAQEILGQVGRRISATGVCLLARTGHGMATGTRPHYVALLQGAEVLTSEACAAAEEFLSQVHHYRLARELGQLDSAQAIVTPDALGYYANVMDLDRKIAGNLKVEALALWKS